MTTIKLNASLKIGGCSSCPFAVYENILDHGEVTGEYYAYCGLIEEDNERDCKEYCYEYGGDYEYVREDRRPNCPIISIEEEP